MTMKNNMQYSASKATKAEIPIGHYINSKLSALGPGAQWGRLGEKQHSQNLEQLTRVMSWTPLADLDPRLKKLTSTHILFHTNGLTGTRNLATADG